MKTCAKIFHRRCLIRVKSGIANVISINYAKIIVDSCNLLPLEKTMTFHNVTTLIKSVWNNNQNHYYYNLFLGKSLYKLPKL